MEWSTATVLIVMGIGNLGTIVGLIWFIFGLSERFAAIKLEMTRLIGLNSESNPRETLLRMDTGVTRVSSEEIVPLSDEEQERQRVFDEIYEGGIMSKDQERILSRG